MTTWKSIQAILSGQMTKSQYNSVIATATATTEGDTLTIHPQTHAAYDWMTNRLDPLITRTAKTQGIDTIRYIDPDTATAATDDDPDTFEAHEVHTDPTRQYVNMSIYAIRFWQPLIGAPAFSLWMTLRAFAWQAEKDAWASIETLADICANGNRQRITGRAASKSRPNPTIGLLEILKKYDLARVKVIGKGRESRYRFSVLATIDVLTPAQAAKLSPRLQHQHLEWLKRHQITKEQWEQSTK